MADAMMMNPDAGICGPEEMDAQGGMVGAVLQFIRFETKTIEEKQIIKAGIGQFEDFRYLVEKDIRDMANEFGQGNSTRRIADAKRLKTESAFPFNKFLDLLQHMFTIFEEKIKPLTEQAKVDEMLTKHVQHTLLAGAVAQLRYQLNTVGITFFTIAANHLKSEIFKCYARSALSAPLLVGEAAEADEDLTEVDAAVVVVAAGEAAGRGNSNGATG